MYLGTELRRIRKRRNETLAEVSKETGISVSFLSGIERGQTNPSLDTLNRLVDYYQLPANLLLAASGMNGLQNSANLPGYSDFVSQMGDKLSENVKNLLVQVHYNARKPAKTKEDWMRYYYLLEPIVG
jgi:transcriptional regulator with XRE-family HTH domain